ncbi:MAG: protein-glutamate O-methyltransferase CheR [Leptospiraceae bacterium]|nr:protein-glutamate O-methyltransferase CheR [Leptospiraceae bacterium]
MSSNGLNLTEKEFRQIRDLFFSLSGVLLSDAKKSLVAGRLAKILRERGLENYQQYVEFVKADGSGREKQILVDTLTTNETYFFREEAHFEYLEKEYLPRFKVEQPGKLLRLWSAACSTGAEAYSAAMVCAEVFGMNGWQISGSDISEKTVATATEGLYPIEMADKIPEKLRKRYCMKGIRSQEGRFIIRSEIRERCNFFIWNLMHRPSGFGPFDIIFLRNMLIYFNPQQKDIIIRNIIAALHPAGILIVGHSEALNFAQSYLQKIRPTVYRPASTVQPAAS